MKASSLKLLDSTREVVTAKNGVLAPELVKPAVLGMLSHDIETDAAAEDKATTPKAVNDFMSDKLLGLASQYLTKQEAADVGIYPGSAYEASQTKDLNTVTDQCSVVFPGGSGYTNAPFQEGEEAPAFLLRVYAATVDGTSYRAQYLTELDTGKTWVRGYVNQGWGVWAAGDASAGAPRMVFDKDDVQVEPTGDDQNAAFVTVTSAYTVIGILDNEGNQWSLPNGSLTTNGAYTRIDVSSILASKNITQADMTGIWYVLFASGGEGEVTPPVDESRLLPLNPANGDIPVFDATATIGGGNDSNTKILLHFDTEIKDEAAGNASPVTVNAQKSGTIELVDGGKFGKCAKFVTGSMTVATNLDELNANNWVVSGWFNPDENNHGVSYPTWLSMDDSSTNGFMFDSTGRYGESDGPLFYLDTPPAAGTWHWLAIVKYSGGLRFYLNGAFLNEISAQQRANFCSTLAIGGYAGTHAEGDTERTFNGLVDEVRLQYIPEDEISKWTGTNIAVPTEPYSVAQVVGEWSKVNKSAFVQTVNDTAPDENGNVTLEISSETDLSNYTTTDNISLKTTASNKTLTLSTSGGSINIHNTSESHASFVLDGNTVKLNGGGVSLTAYTSAGIKIGNGAGSPVMFLVSSIDKLMLQLGMSGPAAGANTANGIAVVGSDGKLPASIVPSPDIDWANINESVIHMNGRAIYIDASQYSNGSIDISAATIDIGASGGNTNVSGRNIYIGDFTGGISDVIFIMRPDINDIQIQDSTGERHSPNTAGGFAIVGSDGKLPSSIIPVSGNRHPFTSSDLSSNVLTITTTGNVTGVIDDTGKSWNFADEEVTYTDSTVSVDLSGVLARKGIATPTGTWKLMLYGA